MPDVKQLDLSGNEVLDVPLLTGDASISCTSSATTGLSLASWGHSSSSSSKGSIGGLEMEPSSTADMTARTSPTTNTISTISSSSRDFSNSSTSNTNSSSGSHLQQHLHHLNLSSTGITPTGLAHLLTLPQLQHLQLLNLRSCQNLPTTPLLQHLKALPNSSCCYCLDITIGSPHTGAGDTDVNTLVSWLQSYAQQLQEVNLNFKVRRAELLPIFTCLTGGNQLQVLVVKQPSMSPLCSGCYDCLAAMTQLTKLEIKGRVAARGGTPQLGALRGLRELSFLSMPVGLASGEGPQQQQQQQGGEQQQQQGEHPQQDVQQLQQQQQSPWLPLLLDMAGMTALTSLQVAYFSTGSNHPAAPAPRAAAFGSQHPATPAAPALGAAAFGSQHPAAAAALGALTQLRALHIQGDLQSFATLQPLTNLEVLELSRVVGADFQHLQGFSRLQELSLGFTALTGSKAAGLFGALAPLSRLTRLELRAGDLSSLGTLPVGVSELRKLEALQLSYWVVDEVGGESLRQVVSGLPRLSELGLCVQRPTREGYAAAGTALRPLARLRRLSLASNFLNCGWEHVPCPLGLSVLSQLTCLSLGYGPEGLLEFDSTKVSELGSYWRRKPSGFCVISMYRCGWSV